MENMMSQKLIWHFMQIEIVGPNPIRRISIDKQNSWQEIFFQLKLPMTGFETGSSNFKSNHAVHWATATAHYLKHF